MPIKIIKGSFEYCVENKLFFSFLLILFFLTQYLLDLITYKIIAEILFSLIFFGYGLQVTQDIIDGGNRLPKITPKKIINFGIKGYLVFAFYILIQSIFLILVSSCLNFPAVDAEELILEYNETIHLFMAHDWVSFIIFVASTFFIVYVTSFFMELALARLADGGNLKNAFNFPKIKRAIDVIGWKKYAWGYTKIILSVVILSDLLRYNIPFSIMDILVDTVLSFLIFVIQFMGIGNVYKVYMDTKLKNNIK